MFFSLGRSRAETVKGRESFRCDDGMFGFYVLVKVKVMIVYVHAQLNCSCECYGYGMYGVIEDCATVI